MADEPQPTTKALLLQATPSSETTPELNKVSALALHSSHYAIANAPKIITNGAITTDMPSNPKTPHSPEQDCPLFKLSTELRALLYTCRNLRTESIDAMEPLANAAKSSLQSEIHLVASRTSAAIREISDDSAIFVAYLTLDHKLNRMQSSMAETDEVCSVLAFAREADKKIRAGG